MNDPERTAVDQLDSLIDAYLRDLLELPDEALLEDGSSAIAQSNMFRKLVEHSAAEAGRRRLAIARRELAKRAQAASSGQTVDLAKARQFLAESANDSRITLAARDLQELPNEEIIRLYVQLTQLEADVLSRKNK